MDQHWEAARLTIRGAFNIGAEMRPSMVGELGDIRGGCEQVGELPGRPRYS